jgi:hypothetical protein
MKREEIKAIFADATDEQLKAVMDLNGADVEKAKSKVTALETELKEKTESLDNLSKEFEDLKANNASAEEYKSKYEALVADNEAKAKQAEADRILAEKTENINKRFEAVVGEKTFSHNAIKVDYLKKFGEAIELEDNKSLSDEQIFHNLIKDDATAFTGVTAVKLQGGTPSGVGGKSVTREDFNKMSYKERLQIYNENQALYNELTT